MYSSRVNWKNLHAKRTKKDKINVYSRLNPDVSRDDDDEVGTLCQCALKIVKDVLPETKLTSILSLLLAQERADTLSK